MIFDNDYSKGDDINSAKREAGGGSDSSGYYSDYPTING